MVFSFAARSASAGALRASASSSLLRPSAARIPSAVTLGRRGYAEAVSDKLKLSFILPHAVSISGWIGGTTKEMVHNGVAGRLKMIEGSTCVTRARAAQYRGDMKIHVQGGMTMDRAENSIYEIAISTSNLRQKKSKATTAPEERPGELAIHTSHSTSKARS